jgi:hypothetical protein
MRFVRLSVTLAALASCTTLPSSSLKTSGMSAQMSVVASGNGSTQVSAQFNVGSNSTDFVDLSAGDTLTAQAGSQTQPMARSSFAGVISYGATFLALDAADTKYTIALTRSMDVSAPSSIATLPKPFNITAPTANSSFSRANSDITVTYDNFGTQDSMSWSAGGDCVKGLVGGTVANDAGSLVIAKGTLLPTDASQAGVTCVAHITLTRQRPGQLDPHYGAGGSIFAQQTRTVTFSSAP